MKQPLSEDCHILEEVSVPRKEFNINDKEDLFFEELFHLNDPLLSEQEIKQKNHELRKHSTSFTGSSNN